MSLLLFLLLASTAIAQSWRSNPFVPPAVPLAVKSPYLQTWLRQGAEHRDGSLNAIPDGSLNVVPGGSPNAYPDERVCAKPDLPQLFPETN